MLPNITACQSTSTPVNMLLHNCMADAIGFALINPLITGLVNALEEYNTGLANNKN